MKSASPLLAKKCPKHGTVLVELDDLKCKKCTREEVLLNK